MVIYCYAYTIVISLWLVQLWLSRNGWITTPYDLGSQPGAVGEGAAILLRAPEGQLRCGFTPNSGDGFSGANGE